MKSGIGIVIFSLATLFCKAQQQEPALKITQLQPNVYVYTTSKIYGGSPFPSNGLYVITSKGAIVIDSPWDTTQFQPLLDSIWLKHHKKVLLAIATHSHADRTAALDFFRSKGIRTYTTRLTDSISRAKHEPLAEYLIEKDTTFRTGKVSFRVYYPGEGHTKDNIVVWFPDYKVLYGGCLVKSTEAGNLGNIEEASLEKYPATIRNLQHHFPNARYIIPGHQGWSDPSSLEHTLKMLQDAGYK